MNDDGEREREVRKIPLGVSEGFVKNIKEERKDR